MLLLLYWIQPLLAWPAICRAELSACEKCLAWAAAVEVLKDLRLKHLDLDQVAGNAAISALSGRWVLALELLPG